MGGMRGVAFGSLLGLSNFRKDAYAAGLHAYMIQKKNIHGQRYHILFPDCAHI